MGEGGTWGYYVLCMVLTEWTGPPNNGAVGLLHGFPLPACRVDNTPVLAAAHCGNDCVVIP